jgi:hypothetical protein
MRRSVCTAIGQAVGEKSSPELCRQWRQGGLGAQIQASPTALQLPQSGCRGGHPRYSPEASNHPRLYGRHSPSPASCTSSVRSAQRPVLPPVCTGTEPHRPPSPEPSYEQRTGASGRLTLHPFMPSSSIVGHRKQYVVLYVRTAASRCHCDPSSTSFSTGQTCAVPSTVLRHQYQY